MTALTVAQASWAYVSTVLLVGVLVLVLAAAFSHVWRWKP